MANRHFGKLADVWKHLVVTEVLAAVAPERYAETHAGSAAYPVVDDAERRYGILGFLAGPLAPDLAATPFVRGVSAYVGGDPPLYPGSALQAMSLLEDDCDYLFCDLDPESVRDLRDWAGRLGLTSCEVAERDGMAAVREWLPDRATTVIHIDPFDPFAHEVGQPSAVELAAEVADAGHGLVYWYGYSAPAQRAWALREIASRTNVPLWCGDLLITDADGSVRDDGDLGDATSAGTGSGVVLANVPSELLARCGRLAGEVVRSYDGRALPNGDAGRLDLVVASESTRLAVELQGE